MRTCTFGRLPEPAIWNFDTLRLCVFIGVVDLTAGPSFIAGLKATGIGLVWLWCRRSCLIARGACAGVGTITAALRAIQDEANSRVPAPGYTVPYTIGNILLAGWGPVLVAIMWVGH